MVMLSIEKLEFVSNETSEEAIFEMTRKAIKCNASFITSNYALNLPNKYLICISLIDNF